MVRRLRGKRPADEGSIALETAILVPCLLLLIGLAVAGGRIRVAESAVDSAARAAAREASISRSESDARDRATDTVARHLRQDGLNCVTINLDIDTSRFAPPDGRGAKVTVNLRCDIRLADTALPGVPGTKTLRASFTSPVDRFRQKT